MKTKIDKAVRDVCSVAVAPASKSEVKRIISALVDEAELEGARRYRDTISKRAYDNQDRKFLLSVEGKGVFV